MCWSVLLSAAASSAHILNTQSVADDDTIRCAPQVMSFEVLEHVDPKHLDTVLDLLANATRKYLVFSAGRPGQGGTGHVNLHTREEYAQEFIKRGLRLLPELTGIASASAWQPRAYDIGGNVQIFAAAGVDVVDTEEVHELVYAHYGRQSAMGFEHDPPELAVHGFAKSGPGKWKGGSMSDRTFFQHDKSPQDMSEHVFNWFITSTLWPKTHHMLRDKAKLCEGVKLN